MRKKMLMELKPLKVMSRYIADAKESEKSLIPWCVCTHAIQKVTVP